MCFSTVSSSKRPLRSWFSSQVSHCLPKGFFRPLRALLQKKSSRLTMSSTSSNSFNLDEDFMADCLAISRQVESQAPFTTSSMLVSPSAPPSGKISISSKGKKIAEEGNLSTGDRLTDRYRNAYADFYGSDTPCIYKSGPEWYVREGPKAQGIKREPRPVYQHPIGAEWLAIGKQIYHNLDLIGIDWTSIDPLAYANVGEATPFCPLIIAIGVTPNSLEYDTAVAAASGVKKVLADNGFPDIEVAFIESIVISSVRTPSSKLLSFEPLLDNVPDLRKPFTPTLGLSIAPLRFPHFEGTGGLYFRLNKEENRIALLTCAHVARPPPVLKNTGIAYKGTGQAREEFIALGSMAYDNALNTMMHTIGNLVDSIEVWNNVLERLGKPVRSENIKITERRNEHLDLVEKGRQKIVEINALHSEITKRCSTFNQRVIGHVLHSEKIQVGADPKQFTKDWALIELYNDKIDWSTFKGNKLYVGGNLSIGDYGNIMFPQDSDRAGYHYPEDGLLQAYGIVEEAEMKDPQHLDIHGEKCLLVIKNGMRTGTTVGRTNGLESFTRFYPEYGITGISIEFAVISYGTAHGNFSDAGDSGSIVLDRGGRIVGILTGGRGPTNRTGITYLTPYWWIAEQVKARFPSSFLYDVVP